MKSVLLGAYINWKNNLSLKYSHSQLIIVTEILCGILALGFSKSALDNPKRSLGFWMKLFDSSLETNSTINLGITEGASKGCTVE